MDLTFCFYGPDIFIIGPAMIFIESGTISDMALTDPFHCFACRPGEVREDLEKRAVSQREGHQYPIHHVAQVHISFHLTPNHKE